jgi:arabinose-5-phosphate isomerase
MNDVASVEQIAEQPDAIKIAIESLHDQALALIQIANRLGDEFNRAIELILTCSGRTIVTGMGKSGLIGKKMASTFASTGTPSFFIHPGEAFHGDLGMIIPGDLVILISYSGETEEVIRLIPSLKNFGNPIIGVMGNQRSTLGKHSDIALDVAVEREICPHNLAPTTSTLATLAMGDAMAIALIKARNFKPMDFARFHPGGSLGRRLLTRVRDVMRTDNLPYVVPSTKVRECVFTMTSGRLGLALVVEDGCLRGIITDGDLRRAMLRDSGMMDKPVREFMTPDPVTIQTDTLLVEAEEIMQERKITALIVMEGRFQSRSADDICGVLEIYDKKIALGVCAAANEPK